MLKIKSDLTRFPRTIFLSHLYSDRYLLTQPLPVELEFGAKEITIVSYDLNIYGVGETEDEAIDDFCLSLIETYEDIENHQNALGSYLQQIWNYLSKVVSKEA